MATKSPRVRQWLVATALVAGAGIGSAGIATAATSSSSSSTAPAASSATSTPAPSTNAPDPATMHQGPGETLLTGTDRSKATAAAQASQSGATVIRAETDSSGKGTYEVHMKKADGSDVTVYLDANFNVTSSDTGFGGGPKGSQPPANGQAPAPSSSSSSSTTN